jgi:hypothetical protein
MGAPGFNYVLRAVYDYANYMWNENDLGYENKLQQWEVEYKKYDKSRRNVGRFDTEHHHARKAAIGPSNKISQISLTGDSR